MRFSVQANENGIALVRLDGRVVWSAPVNAGVIDFSLEVTSAPGPAESIKCEWVERPIDDGEKTDTFWAGTPPLPPAVTVAHPRLYGIVRWFNDAKGFGFLDQVRTGDTDVSKRPSVFVSWRDIEVKGFATLEQGQLVTFELHQTEKGTVAKKVRPDPVPSQVIMGGKRADGTPNA